MSPFLDLQESSDAAKYHHDTPFLSSLLHKKLYFLPTISLT